jgi:hypothetical protein
MKRNPMPSHVDSLEPRRLLAGVTLITHGFQSDGVMPQWVARMAEGVDRRIEPGAAVPWTDASRFRLRVTASNSTTATVESFTRTAGPSVQLSKTGEAVIELDWAVASGLTGPSTAIVAQAVLGALQSPDAGLGFGSRGILGLPIHLIGHSRGASLVADLARQLGQLGVAVDHLTTLDPFPLGADPGPSRSVNVPDNVVFADNYYENTDFFVYGGPVTGAINTGPLALPGGASLAHSDVHTYYHGSIDRGDTSDGDVTLNTAWYGTTLNRATTAFDWSLVSGGVRPASGLSPFGGGSAARVAVATTIATPFPNALPVSITPSSELLTAGSTLTFAARYQTHTSSSEIDFYLDTDRNLTNGFFRAITTTGNVAPTGATPNFGTDTAVYSLPLFTGGGAIPPGVYYMNAFITDGTAGHVREFLYPQRLLVTSQGARLINKEWSDDVGSHDAADPRNYSPGGLPLNNDQLLIAFGSASAGIDLSMKGLALLGSAQFSSSVSQTIRNVDVLGTSKFTLASSGSAALSTQGLWLAPTARLDLKNNMLVIDYAAASPLATVAASVTSAYSGGTWTGNGIGSSLAGAPGRTVGFAEATRIASTFPTTIAGVNVDSTAVVVRFTAIGDTNLDRAVGFDDLLSLAQAYDQSSRTYADGDTDFDSDVDFGDLLALAQQYGSTLAIQSAPIRNRRVRMDSATPHTLI